MHENRTLFCKSVFHNGENAPTAEHYTQVWIDLINQLEKSKEIIAAVR